MRIGSVLQRRIVFLLIACVIFTMFNMYVYADELKPVDLTALYTDDFSDGQLSGNIDEFRFYPGEFMGYNADTLKETGGKLTFERKKWIWYDDPDYGEPVVTIYSNESHAPVSGDLFTEFTLSKTREVVRLRFCDDSGNYLTQISWEGDTFRFSYRNPDLTSSSKTMNISADSTVKISLRADYSTVRPTFTIWINDVIQCSNVVSATDMKSANFSHIQVYTLLYSSYTKAGKFMIDDLGIYRVNADLPIVEQSILDTGFDTDNLPCKIEEDLSGGGNVEVSDGKLFITKNGEGSSAVGASIYCGKDSSTVTGVIGLEYDIERENYNAVQIRSMDPNGNLYYSLSWGSDKVSANYSDDKSTQGISHGVFDGSYLKLHLNMLFDTINSTYWLWINERLVVSGKYSRSVGVGSFCYTMFYLESINSISVDNYKVYHAIPPKNLRLKFDLDSFDKNDMLNEVTNVENVITNSLSLPNMLRYGTVVTWSSSEPDIINPETGAVTRPISDNPSHEVTLTANFSYNGEDETREYKYYVLSNIPEGIDYQKMEVEDIKMSQLTDESPDQIKKSLNLNEKGVYGSDVIWSSSDTDVITNSGRVIRPEFDEADRNVELTASIGNYQKTFVFVVKSDEKPNDPLHTSDEDFFGVWNGNEFTVIPQLNYELSGLKVVCEHVKNNNYKLAKEALLSYFRSRNVPSPIGVGNRHSGWVDARADGLLEMGEESALWKGHMVVESDDYEEVIASVYQPSLITPSACKTFELISRYNENTSAYIIGKDNADVNMIPKLEVTVNGKSKEYSAIKTATIRAGKYSSEHINDNNVLYAKMFGEFLGDETSRILLGFDLSDISSSDSITSAKLKVYAKKSSLSAENKELWIIDNKNSEWNENSVCWNSFNFNVHNYNGIVGGTDWKGAKSSDVEYAYQAPRFAHARSTMAEYRATGNEKYAYTLLNQVFDIICDTGDVTPYPRSLDAALRMHQLVPLMNVYKDSKYLTADFCTAFLKYLYKQFEYFPSRVDATGNWREYEQLAVLYATSAYPELTNSESTKNSCIESWKNALSKSFMPDGTYIEDTGGYHRSSFNMYRDFKKNCVNAGIELSSEFDELLHKAAYYMALTNGPDGLTLQYGDEPGGRSKSGNYAEIADWYNDEELRFIDSFGEKGIAPAWTSYQFTDGRYTIMRSSWDKDSLYLHTNVRGGGGHGHADDNSIILMAGGRRLLVDSGRFSYNSYEPARLYGMSTQGHNTVVINNASQRMDWTGDNFSVRGNINNWVSNSDFDLLSQSTISYPEHDHTRSIFFIKDGLFVVSDLMKPENKNTVNNYKQYWHMTPEADITADPNFSSLKSNFSYGKNIVISCADTLDTYLEDGYYDMADGVAVANKSGVFELSSTGDSVIDTVMYVSDSTDSQINVERLDTGNPSHEITALKITIMENEQSKVYYYMYNYGHNDTQAVSFGGFQTDARAAIVGEDNNGAYKSIMINDGSYLYKDEKIILNSQFTTNLSATYDSNKIKVVSSDEELDSETIKLTCNDDIKDIFYNDKYMDYSVADGIVQIGAPKDAGLYDDVQDIMQIIRKSVYKTTEGTEYIINDMDFSHTKGENGSAVTYSVSDTSLIDENGKITRDMIDRDVEISVTFSKGNTTIIEEIFAKVPGKYNRIGKGDIPFVSGKYPVSRVITDTNTAGKTDASVLTEFKNDGGVISLTSAYASGKEPGFTCKYSDNLKGDFVHEFTFSSNSNAMRLRFADSSWGQKLDVYYLDNGTLAVSGASQQYHIKNFKNSEINLVLSFTMNTNSVDIYVDGELWLEQFPLSSANYKNVQYVMLTHHCATLMGVWRSGQGTTTITAFDVYKTADKQSVSSIMTSGPKYSNNGTPTIGLNTVTMPVVATDKTGELQNATMVYAIYSGTKAKKLVGVATQKLELDRFSHNEYTIGIELESSYTNTTQKVFVIGGLDTIKPLTSY